MAEVLVIGGGPAGCAAAITLAKAGREVLLIERNADARHKVCGEFLSLEALTYLPRLGIDVAALGGVPIHTARFGAGRAIPLPFAARSLTRRTLDEALLQSATAAGVRVLRGCSAEALSLHTVETSSGPVQAQTIFVATGKHDLRGHARPAGRQGNLVAMKMYWRLSPAQTAALAGSVELLLYSGGYAGLQPVENGAANLCCLIERERFRLLGGQWPALLAHMLHYAPQLAARLHGAEPLLEQPLAISAIPYGFVRESSEGYWHLGDQAAVIPSFTGDGMSIALHTGLLAARMYLEGERPQVFQHKVFHDLRPAVQSATWLSLGLLQYPRALMFASRLLPAALRQVASATRIPPHAMLA